MATFKMDNVQVTSHEEVVDTNPELYLERMEHFISLKEYEQALEECGFYRKLGGDKSIYDINCQRIKDIRDGKVIAFTETEERILFLVKEVLGVKMYATPDFTLYQMMKSMEADSLDLFQINMAIEEEFDIEISEEEIEVMEQWTLRRIGEFIDRKRGLVSSDVVSLRYQESEIKKKEKKVAHSKDLQKSTEINKEREKYGKILSMDENNRDALFNLARIEMSLGNFKQAITYLKRLENVTVGNDRLQVYQMLGELYEKEGNIEAAIRCYQNIYTSDTSYTSGICSLARLYYEDKKDIKSAVQILNESFNKSSDGKIKVTYLCEMLRAVRVQNNPVYQKLEENLYKRLESFHVKNNEQNLINSTVIIESMKEVVDREDFECFYKLESIYKLYGIDNAELNESVQAYRELVDFLKREQVHEAVRLYLGKELAKESKEQFGKYILYEAELIRESLEKIKKQAPKYWKHTNRLYALEKITNDNLQTSKEYIKLSKDRALSPYIKKIMEYILLDEYVCYEDIEQEFEKEKVLFFEKEDKALYQHTIDKMQEYYPTCYEKFSDVFFDCTAVDTVNKKYQDDKELGHGGEIKKKTKKIKKEDWKVYHPVRNAIISFAVAYVIAGISVFFAEDSYFGSGLNATMANPVGALLVTVSMFCFFGAGVFLWFGLLRLIYKQATTKRLWGITGIFVLCIFMLAITLTGIGAISWVIIGRTVIAGIKNLWPTDEDLGLVEIDTEKEERDSYY